MKKDSGGPAERAGRSQKKYETIVSWVHAQLDSGSLVCGSRLPSEKDLMEQFQVSRQTVRRALEELASAGITESRRGSGTYIAVNRRKKPGDTVRIAVMLTHVDTYIFPAIVKGIESVLSGKGCMLQISMTDNAVEKERMLLKDFIRGQTVDGLIAEPVKSGLPNPNLELYKELENAGIPVLFINSFYRDIDIPHVSLDDRAAGYAAAKHLLDCGHRKIGGIFKSDDGQGHLRYAGYTRALMEQDIRVRGGKIIWIDSDEIREMEEESARIIKRLKECTACVCYNDEIAYRLVGILQSAGIAVPGDISVVGIDNSSLAQFGPVPLTSIENPAEELGRTAAELMVQKIRGEGVLATREFQPRLVMRNSVRVWSELL
ncbi:arabinose metabolism transcriptional repressor [Lachnoclostridium sp. An169]|uniref:GntR family transcriptional regulator n=1 Tax=Lachnoclostridium sp. An169 TaxID=1965569 RepID=UPI000B3A6675|nr:GntR family transcriptional regulator [Lachnoclostridium sp. An169]OUP82816.1 arabinose metabolism transcriptional repressor [Lachnoclostridium sp. An169]